LENRQSRKERGKQVRGGKREDIGIGPSKEKDIAEKKKQRAGVDKR